MNHGKINWNEELKDEFGGGFVLRRESELDPPLIETVMNRDRFVSSGNLSAGSAGDAVVKGLSWAISRSFVLFNCIITNVIFFKLCFLV